MCNLRWLELNRTNVSRLPESIGKLKALVNRHEFPLLNYFFIVYIFSIGKIKLST